MGTLADALATIPGVSPATGISLAKAVEQYAGFAVKVPGVKVLAGQREGSAP